MHQAHESIAKLLMLQSRPLPILKFSLCKGWTGLDWQVKIANIACTCLHAASLLALSVDNFPTSRMHLQKRSMMHAVALMLPSWRHDPSNISAVQRSDGSAACSSVMHYFPSGA